MCDGMISAQQRDRRQDSDPHKRSASDGAPFATARWRGAPAGRRRLGSGQVRPWVARRELTGFWPGRAPCAALRRDGRVIIARARPVIEARHSVGVVQQHRVVHSSSNSGSAAIQSASPDSSRSIWRSAALGREESRLPLTQQPVQVGAVHPGHLGSPSGACGQPRGRHWVIIPFWAGVRPQWRQARARPTRRRSPLTRRRSPLTP